MVCRPYWSPSLRKEIPSAVFRSAASLDLEDTNTRLMVEKSANGCKKAKNIKKHALAVFLRYTANNSRSVSFQIVGVSCGISLGKQKSTVGFWGSRFQDTSKLHQSGKIIPEHSGSNLTLMFWLRQVETTNIVPLFLRSKGLFLLLDPIDDVSCMLMSSFRGLHKWGYP